MGGRASKKSLDITTVPKDGVSEDSKVNVKEGNGIADGNAVENNCTAPQVTAIEDEKEVNSSNVTTTTTPTTMTAAPEKENAADKIEKEKENDKVVVEKVEKEKEKGEKVEKEKEKVEKSSKKKEKKSSGSFRQLFKWSSSKKTSVDEGANGDIENKAIPEDLDAETKPEVSPIVEASAEGDKIEEKAEAKVEESAPVEGTEEKGAGDAPQTAEVVAPAPLATAEKVVTKAEETIPEPTSSTPAETKPAEKVEEVPVKEEVPAPAPVPVEAPKVEEAPPKVEPVAEPTPVELPKTPSPLPPPPVDIPAPAEVEEKTPVTLEEPTVVVQAATPEQQTVPSPVKTPSPVPESASPVSESPIPSPEPPTTSPPPPLAESPEVPVLPDPPMDPPAESPPSPQCDEILPPPMEIQQVDSVQAKNAGPIVSMTIEWEHGGNEVAMTGSFLNWVDSMPLTESEGVFSIDVDLPEGEHYCKFFVDGNWTVNSSKPVLELDGQGQVNMIMVRVGSEE